MTKPKDGEGAEALLAQLDVMRKALAPFAGHGGRYPDAYPDEYIPTNRTNGPWGESVVTLGDFRRASEALAPPATPVRGGGNQELSVSQSQPCGEASADAEVFAGLDAEPSAAIPDRATILAVIRAWDEGIGSLSDLTYEDIERRLREAS